MRHFEIPPLSEFSAKVKDPAFRLDSPTGEEITGMQIEKRERERRGGGFEMSIWQCEGFCLADPVQGRLEARQF